MNNTTMIQRIIIGIESIKCLVNAYNLKSAFVVCGNSFDNSVFKGIITSDFMKTIFFMDFCPNPLYKDVEKGIKLFDDSNCDCILVIGGGSAIDVAKCIKLYSHRGSQVILIAIPTTAGSGSESTRHAVIYKDGVKLSISDDAILPNVAILEPRMLTTLPIYQKKCTMLDALCQSIESWWSINSTDESIEYSKQSIFAIKNYWRNYIFEGDEVAAREIMNAANYSGRAINITKTTAPHAMSYKLTSLYNIPHGHSVAISMCHVWDYTRSNINKCIDRRGASYLADAIGQIENIIALDEFKHMLNELEIEAPNSINRESDIELLVKSVNLDRLSNHPVKLEERVIRSFYEEIVG